MRKIDNHLLALIFAAAPALTFAQGLLEIQEPVQQEVPDFQPLFVPVVGVAAYAPNFPIEQNYLRGDRHLDGVVLNGAAVGTQQWDIPTPRKVYTDATNQVFLAKAGDTLKPQFKFTGNWMNGYVYLDYNNDGKFVNSLDENGRPTADSDLVAYSNYKGKNSQGNSSGQGNVLNPPAFTLPADLAPGIYRLRYKVDWDNIEAGGTLPTDGTKGILEHGGGICDILLNVHGEECQVTAIGGGITADDGSALSKTTLPFAKDLKIKVTEEDGKPLIGLRIRHGYHLEGEAMVNGNPQYQTLLLSAAVLKENGFTIPGKYLDGEVEIEAVYGDTHAYFTPFMEGQDYTRSDRHLDAVGLNVGGVNERFDLPSPRKVYTKLLDRCLHAKAGQEVTPVFSYSTNWMNGYVYIDRNNDGVFDAQIGAEGQIPENSDVMAFSHLGGKDSKGNVAKGDVVNPPSFVVPADLANGLYRMRYKVDWDFIDPAGRTGKDNSMMANGGALCDVMLNVHGDSCRVTTVAHPNGEVLLADGSPLEGKQVPFGEPLEVMVSLAPGSLCEAIRVVHGYHLDGPQLVGANPQYFEEVLPAYLFQNNHATIPAAWMDGDVRLEPVVVEATPEVGQDYALNFDEKQERVQSQRLLKQVTFEATRGGTTQIDIAAAEHTVYRDFTPQSVAVVPGDALKVNLDAEGEGLHAYLYIDMNQDGAFSHSVTADGRVSEFSELRSFTYFHGKNSEGAPVEHPTLDEMPVFQIPADLPAGNYRARLKLDVDNADPAGQQTIAEEGGYVVDFLLNVHQLRHQVEIFTTNGNVYGPDHSALPMDITPYTSLDLVPTPVFEGYTADKMLIKLGHNLEGPQYVHGNRQWQELEVDAAPYTIPASEVEGDVAISVHYQKGENAAYDLVFSDEFNAEDGSQPDDSKWIRSPRQGATWNRWISNSNEVVYLQDGKLVTRAIPNPDQVSDPVPMITGAIQSQGKFGFKYGKVECRAKANVWKGTFPAIWLMPVDQHDGWPTCGEIDIFETIDNDHKAYHTIHTHWTFDLKHGPNGSNQPAQHDRYHTYGFEWDATSLKFFVDGKHNWTYRKSDKQNELDQGQWPFDKQFYLILNQSVGNHNVWASYPDENHIYEFLVDWVRVYQKPGMENSNGVVGLNELAAESLLDLEVVEGGVILHAEHPVQVQIYDLTGRCLYHQQLQGTASITLAPGVYVINGKKVMVRY